MESWLSWLWSGLCQQHEDPSTKEVKRFTLGLFVTLIRKVISSDTLHEIIGTLGYFWLDVDVNFLQNTVAVNSLVLLLLVWEIFLA